MLKILAWGLISILYRYACSKIIKFFVNKEHYLDLNTKAAALINRLSLVNISSTVCFWYCVFILELNAIRFKDYQDSSEQDVDFFAPIEQHNLT